MPLHAGGRQPQPPRTPASAGGSRVRSRGSRSGRWWDLTSTPDPPFPPPHAHPSQAATARGTERFPVCRARGLSAERPGIPRSRARVLPLGVSAGLLAPPSGGRSRSRVGPREGTGPLGTQPGSSPRKGARPLGAQLGVRAGTTRRATRVGAGGTTSPGVQQRGWGVTPPHPTRCTGQVQARAGLQDVFTARRGELHTLLHLILRVKSLPQSLVTKWETEAQKGQA